MRLIGTFLVALALPIFAFGALTPDPSTRAKAISPGANQMLLCSSLGGCGNFKGDLNVTFYTPELSHFNDKTCSDGPCRNNVPGIAHRSWPINGCVAVCNLQNKVCAEAIIMDRGPNERLVRRTIDANPALRSVLKMSGGLVPATYQLISLPGQGECKTGMTDGKKYAVSGIDPYNVQPFGGGYSVDNNPYNSMLYSQQPMPSLNGYCLVSTNPIIAVPCQQQQHQQMPQQMPQQPLGMNPIQSFNQPQGTQQLPQTQPKTSDSPLTENKNTNTNTNTTGTSLLDLLKEPGTTKSSGPKVTVGPKISAGDAIVFMREDSNKTNVQTVPYNSETSKDLAGIYAPNTFAQTFIGDLRPVEPTFLPRVASTNALVEILDSMRFILLRMRDIVMGR